MGLINYVFQINNNTSASTRNTSRLVVALAKSIFKLHILPLEKNSLKWSIFACLEIKGWETAVLLRCKKSCRSFQHDGYHFKREDCGVPSGESRVTFAVLLNWINICIICYVSALFSSPRKPKTFQDSPSH